MCVEVLRVKYDLGSSKRKNPLLDEWPQKIKEAEGVLKFDYDALFSEIESNIEEIENNPKKLDNYCTTLLTPFADFLRSVRPVKHRKKEWQKRMEDAELLLKSNNDEDREFAEELKLLAKEEEERQKEIEIGYWEITQMAAKCPPTENFDAYLAERQVEAVFNYIIHILDNYSIRIDWVLAQNGIDLMRLQEEYSIYLLENRFMPHYTHFAGTTEIARKVFGALEEHQPNSNPPNQGNNTEPSFCGIVQHTDKEKVINRLHYLIDGKTGSEVGAILLRAKLDGLLIRVPTKAEFEGEFGKLVDDENSKARSKWEAIRKYMDSENETALNKCSTIMNIVIL